MTKPPRTPDRGTAKSPHRRDAARREGRPRDSGRPVPGAGDRAKGEVAQIWGAHAVEAALGSPRRTPLRLYATEHAAERIAAPAAERGLSPTIVPAAAIASRLPRDAVHQGLLLEARPIAPIELDELPEGGTVLVLDQVTDPHNVGAILRTGAAFAVSGLVMTGRHAPPITGTLAKAASGGLEHVPIATVTNLARALDDLGRLGFFRIGLDSEGPEPLQGVLPPSGGVALVLGAEGSGLRRLTRERCDALARLDLPGKIRSLNVSNACAAALTILSLRTI